MKRSIRRHSCSQRPQHSRMRRGFSIVETVIASLLLATLFITLAPMLAWVGEQRKQTDHRVLAIQEAANIFERLSLIPSDELSSERLQEISLSEQARSTLSLASLVLKVEEESEPAAGKRVSLELSWHGPAGRHVRPLRVVRWLHPKQAKEE